MTRTLSYKIILAGTLLWCTLLLLPPLLAFGLQSMPIASGALYGFFSRVCHQYDERSLHLLGHKLGVCGRCMAIYFGFLVGTLLVPQLARLARWGGPAAWILAVAPMVLDVLLDLTGVLPSTMTTRVVTGGVFGVMAAFLLVPSLVDGINRLFHATTLAKGCHELETR
jgi:uncharacterized membrane protein